MTLKVMLMVLVGMMETMAVNLAQLVRMNSTIKTSADRDDHGDHDVLLMMRIMMKIGKMKTKMKVMVSMMMMKAQVTMLIMLAMVMMIAFS